MSKDSKWEIKSLYLNHAIKIGNYRDGQQYIYFLEDKKVYPIIFKDEIKEVIKFFHNKGSGILIKDLRKEFDDIEGIINILTNSQILNDQPFNNTSSLKKLTSNRSKINHNRKLTETRTPESIKFEITNKCNLKCKYCYVDGVRDREISIDKIKDILIQLKRNGLIFLYLTGGEPLIHKDILEIINLTQELGLITTIQTNGLLIDSKIIHHLKQAKYLTIAISFHSHKKKNFDNFVNREGAYTDILQTFKKLNASNIDSFAKVTITRENEDDIDEILNFLEGNKIRCKIYSHILPDISDKRDTSPYILSSEKFKYLVDKGFGRFNKHVCNALQTKCWISPSGELYPCELVRDSIGNLTQNTFEELWNGKKANDFLVSDLFIVPDGCKNCKYSEYCNSCNAYNRYKSWSNGLNQFCMKAKVHYNNMSSNLEV